jgi:hypothetical protein
MVGVGAALPKRSRLGHICRAFWQQSEVQNDCQTRSIETRMYSERERVVESGAGGGISVGVKQCRVVAAI